MVKPQGHSQHDFSAEHPPSHWAQISNSDASCASDFNELSSFEVWNNFGDDFEQLVSNTNHGDEKIGQLQPSTSDDLEEIEYVDPGSVHGHGGLQHESIYHQILQSGFSMDTSQVPMDARTRCRPCQAVENMSTGPCETFGAESVPGNPTDLGRLKNGQGIPIPRVVVSDATENTVGIRNESAVRVLHTKIPSPTRHDDETQTLYQNLRNASASGESAEYLSDNTQYCPNNYQIAMLDRRPLYNLGNGDQPHFEIPIADTVSAFNADADRTVLDPVALSKTDGSFEFNMCRVTGSIPRFQTPNIPPPGLESCRSSSSDNSSCSIPRSSLQASLYSTPPSSFQETTECHKFGSHLTRDRPPSNPARLPSVGLTDSSSFTSLSPRNAPDEAGKSCRCLLCPDKTFTDSSNLKRHERDIHSGMDRLPCLKEGCDASFAPGRKDNRLKHVRAKHPDYYLPTPSRKRKRKADSDLESGSTDMQGFESGTTGEASACSDVSES